MEWEIFEKLKNFLSKDSSLQSSEETESLEWELQEKLFPMDMSERVFDENQGGYVPKKVKYAYEHMEMPFNLRKEIPDLLDKFYARQRDFYCCPLSEKVIRPYLEDPKKPFKEEWRGSILKIRKFLRNKKVKTIFHSLPAIEVDFKHGEVVDSKHDEVDEVKVHRHFSPDEVKVFIVSTLEPYAFHWIRRTEEGSIYTETLCSSTGEPMSKPGPKNVRNRAIIVLRILFEECFKQKHVSFYRYIADLFNASEMERRTDWKPRQIQMRYERIKKDSSFNEKFWYEYYKNELAMCSNFHKTTGLIELVKKINA